MKKKSNRGGKRKGAGRKSKYSEPTTTIAFRVPKSKVKSVTDAVKGVVDNIKRFSRFDLERAHIAGWNNLDFEDWFQQHYR